MRFPADQRFRALATTTALLVAVITGGGLTAAQDSTPATGPQSEFFVQQDFEEQLRLRDVEPEGPADQPWIQALEPESSRPVSTRKIHPTRSASPTPASTTPGALSVGRRCRPKSSSTRNC